MRAVKESVHNSPGLSFCFQERTEPLSYSWHFHEEYELTLIIRGSGRRFIGDEVTDYTDGDFVLIGPNIPHAYESDESILGEPCSTVIIQFGPELFTAGRPHSTEFRHIHRMLGKTSSGLEFDPATAASILPLLREAERHSGLEKLLDFLGLMDTLATRGSWQTIAAHWTQSANASVEHEGPREASEILQYVFANAGRRVTLQSLSGYAGKSVASLCRFFKRDLGCTFNEYLTRIRISQACKLLIQTNLPIYSVSYESGFENLSNFNRRFLKVKGMTPSAYRRLHRRASSDLRSVGLLAGG